MLQKLQFSSTHHNLLYVQKIVIKAFERVWFRTCAPVDRAGGKMALSYCAGQSWKDRSRTWTAAGERSKLEYDPGGGGEVGKRGTSVGCPSQRSGRHIIHTRKLKITLLWRHESSRCSLSVWPLGRDRNVGTNGAR